MLLRGRRLRDLFPLIPGAVPDTEVGPGMTVTRRAFSRAHLASVVRRPMTFSNFTV